MTDKPTEKVPAKKAPAKKAAAKKAAPKKAATAAAPAPRVVRDEELDRVVGGAHHDPHSILGAHVGDGAVTVRALRPGASKVTVTIGDARHEMRHERGGIWVTLLDTEQVPDYRLLVDYGDGFEHTSVA